VKENKREFREEKIRWFPRFNEEKGEKSQVNHDEKMKMFFFHESMSQMI